jgi:hypothetical protein
VRSPHKRGKDLTKSSDTILRLIDAAITAAL